MLRFLIVAAALLTAAPASAVCIPAAEFRNVLAEWGESVRYAGMSARAGQPTPVYVSVSDDGGWTVFFIGDGAVACLLATGTDWTEQGQTPADEPQSGE